MLALKRKPNNVTATKIVTNLYIHGFNGEIIWQYTVAYCGYKLNKIHDILLGIQRPLMIEMFLLYISQLINCGFYISGFTEQIQTTSEFKYKTKMWIV